MNLLLLPMLILTLLSGSDALQAECTRPPQGIPGFLSANYIGSYSDTIQPLTNGVPEDVIFPNNSTSPIGITKSVTNDSFTIQTTGVYLIYWTVNGETQHIRNPPNTLALNLKVNGNPVMSRPSSLASFANFLSSPPFKLNVSGRTTLALQAGDIITLEALGTFTESGETMQINSAIIDIIKIPTL